MNLNDKLTSTEILSATTARGVVSCFVGMIPGLCLLRTLALLLVVFFLGSCVVQCSVTEAGKDTTDIVHQLWSHAVSLDWSP